MSVYNFSYGFQEKILALAWREPSFFTIYRDCLKPQYFESEVHIDVYRMISDYYDSYDTSPTFEAIYEEVQKLCSKSKLKKEKTDEYIKTLKNLVSVELSDANYIKDRVIEFGRKQALTEAILKSVDDLRNSEDFSIIEKRISEANLVGQNIGDFGVDYFSTVDERLEGYDELHAERIPTGIVTLDEIMYGGLERGELGVVIAPPGTGKTLSLINIGANAIKKGKNVFHLSLEMSEKSVTQRYDRCFIRKNAGYIKENRKNVAGALKLYPKSKRGRLIVKAYPTRTCSIYTIRSFLSSLKLGTGFVPDVIIIDYADLMNPTVTYKERRSELEIMYEEIRGLSQELDAALWTASQTNRGALDKKVVTIADFAESFGKAAVADFCMALSQTKNEKEKEQLRFFVTKNRNGNSDRTVCCSVNYDTMTILADKKLQREFDIDEDSYYKDSEDKSSKIREKAESEVTKQLKNDFNGFKEGKGV